MRIGDKVTLAYSTDKQILTVIADPFRGLSNKMCVRLSDDSSYYVDELEIAEPYHMTNIEDRLNMQLKLIREAYNDKFMWQQTGHAYGMVEVAQEVSLLDQAQADEWRNKIYVAQLDAAFKLHGIQ